MTQTEDARTYDAELEEYEESLNYGEPWLYPTKSGEEMDPSMPNPWVTRSIGLNTGKIRGEDVLFYTGLDKAGKKWSRIVGTKSLRDVLEHGILTEWDDGRQAFVEVARVGPVRGGERVSVTYRGHTTIKSGEFRGKEIPSLRVERPDARKLLVDRGSQLGPDDDLPI